MKRSSKLSAFMGFVSLALPLNLIFLSGCLKTRAQLRDDNGTSDQASAGSSDSDGPSKPVPNKVTAVDNGSYAVDELKTQMTTMEGRLEDLERTQKDAAANAAGTQTQQEQAKKLEQRVTELEQAQAQMLEAIKKMQDQAPAADPTSLFEQGSSAFDDGNWQAAVDAFGTYLKSPKAKKAEDAHFMRAESNFNLKQYKQAIADYSVFPEKFTKSKHMPEALYKIGLSFDAIGSHDDARGFYQLLVDKFPKSSQAKKVRSKLK